MTRRRDSAALREEVARQRARLDEMRRTLRAQERREAKERAAERARSDRALADALLSDVRAAIGEDVADGELREAVALMLTRYRDEHLTSEAGLGRGGDSSDG